MSISHQSVNLGGNACEKSIKYTKALINAYNASFLELVELKIHHPLEGTVEAQPQGNVGRAETVTHDAKVIVRNSVQSHAWERKGKHVNLVLE